MALFIGTDMPESIGPSGISPTVIAEPPGTLPSAADDIISGGGGNDVISGGNGNDIISGDGGNDTIFGNMGNDTIIGGEGDDNISGNIGDDTLFGGPGNDTLTGGMGADTLTGGPGADTFVLTALNASLVTAFDTITDFTSGTDHIKIGHTIPAGSLNTGNPAAAPFAIAGTDDLAADLTSLLGPTNLLANGAAQVTITGGIDAGSYVVINDAAAGYDPGSDAVVRLLGAPVLVNTDFIT
jgi:Ca2+-binding RTX toxin-like protein